MLSMPPRKLYHVKANIDTETLFSNSILKNHWINSETLELYQLKISVKEELCQWTFSKIIFAYLPIPVKGDSSKGNMMVSQKFCTILASLQHGYNVTHAV